jgi:hypothetical protein
MTNISSVGGLLCCILLFICSCVHIRRVKALKHMLVLAKESGPFSIFHKASVVGIRLQVQLGISCIILAIFILLK